MSARRITCPVCKLTSHNTGDIRNGYCGHCHAVTSEPRLADYLAEVTRVVVVNDSGIAYERRGIDPAFVLQDDGRTLKVFVQDNASMRADISPDRMSVVRDLLEPEDLKIQVFRSPSTAGGMSVPSADTSVKITHLPTGEAAIGTARSSLQAREYALKELRGKVAAHLHTQLSQELGDD